MLNAQKLIFILPDVAYIAELLPTKKEHTFSVQTFHQINGEFLDDNTFIADNVSKLIHKIDPEEYVLVLPDFLFTNTIVEVAETSKKKVEDHITSSLLPEIGLDTKTHQINHFVLTQHKNKSKVQLSAIENTVLGPITQAAEEHELTISGVAPLSWTTKGMVSLEPSISIVQLGSMLYLALHYIGVDQTISFTVDQVENIVETIKTLKGAEPSIQTLYLLTNQHVEAELKEQLSSTLPLQQLTNFTEDESDIPPHVKQIIETVMKTLDVPDFSVPLFDIEKGEIDPNAAATAITEGEEDADEEIDELTDSEVESEFQPEEDEEEEEEDKVDSDESEEVEETEESEESELPDTEETDDEEPLPKPTLAAAAAAPAIAEIAPDDSSDTATTEAEDTAKEETTPEATDVAADVAPIEIADVQPVTEKTPQPAESAETTETPEANTPEKKSDTATTGEPDLSQFAPKSNSDTMTSSKAMASETPKKSNVIKNNPGTSGMIKMVFITLTVLFITVAIGVGIGLGFLSYSNRTAGEVDTTPVVVASPEPTAETAEPEPSPSPELEEVAKDEVEILVVNATTVAGKAGDIADLLEDAEFENVSAANAKGDYDEEVMYVLMSEENASLQAALEEALNQELTFSDEVATEDPNDSYDAVIVIADPDA